MSILALQHVSLTLAGQVLLDHVSLQIQPKTRIALVGRNGAGKSTLLKLLQGQLLPDSGTLQRKANLRIASLVQDVPIQKNETVYHFLAHELGPLGQVFTQYRNASRKGDTITMAQCQTAIDTENAWDLLPRIETIASHLGLNPDAPMNTLSGGMRRRALLGAALLAEPQLLLLDEPTNHLDIKTIEWLEAHLKAYSGTLVLVTHDRTFLSRIATDILAIDRGKLYLHHCNYETYLNRQAAIQATEITQNSLFDRRLKEEEAWLRKGIKARRTRNEGRVRKLKAMREAYAARREQLGEAKAHHLSVKASGKHVLHAEQLTYQQGEKKIIDNFSCNIIRGDKVGIIGPNGCGKTTLIRLLLKNLPPTSGQVEFGTKLDIAYFDQLRRELTPEQTVMQNVADGADFVTINGQNKHVASYLREFLFPPERFNQPVASLSGGERNRLLLARLFAKPINLLVMDEPTNDLDIETLELLESILLEYKGTLLLISHDRAFLNQVVTNLFVFESDGKIIKHPGSFDDYMTYKKTLSPLKKTASTIKKAHKKSQQTTAEARELKQLPKTIERLESEISTLHLEMSAPAFYEGDAAKIDATTEKLQALEAKLATTYDRWEKLEQTS